MMSEGKDDEVSDLITTQNDGSSHGPGFKASLNAGREGLKGGESGSNKTSGDITTPRPSTSVATWPDFWLFRRPETWRMKSSTSHRPQKPPLYSRDSLN